MPNIRGELQFDFHPVGQGLFATGSIGLNGASPFRWVYDCGTSSKQKLIDAAIASLVGSWGEAREEAPGIKPAIDLVIISHFDEDHISGIVGLLKAFRVRYLLLPYMPLWKRLAAAFDQGIRIDDPFMQFFVNPVAYIRRYDDARDVHFLFVPESDGDGPSPEPGGGEDEGGSEISIDLRFDGSPKDSSPGWSDDTGAFNRGQSASLLAPSSRLRLGNLWEFVPYNDAHLVTKVSEEFISFVNKLGDNLLSVNTSEKERRDIIRKIKSAYCKTFGHDAAGRNQISLFVYAGQIPKKGRHFHTTFRSRFECDRVFGVLNDHHIFYEHWYRGHHGTSTLPNILYTGDGYLNNEVRLLSLRRYFGNRNRLRNLGVLQVMHHGARDNWYHGVANSLAPSVSVFCSDPNRKRLGHPHAEVLRDFWNYCPVQVDQYRSLEMRCDYWL